MDPVIVAAIITVVGVIIAALISRSRKKEKSSQAESVEVRVIQPPAAPQKPTPEKTVPKPPIPYFAHPYPLQENFTGRLSERKELTEWFTKGSQPMFAYVAIGGMGKSALTWYWLHEDIIKNGLAPEGIIWWSFYDREARFETFLMKAIQYVSNGEVDVKGITSNRDRMEQLYTLLCNNRFLLVLDGVERVLRAYAGLGSPYQGDEVKEDERGDFRTCIDPNVGTFLQWLASSTVKTKTLLTSRLFPKELDRIAGCFHRELKELDKEDAVDFFHRQGVKGTRAEIESACEPYGYHPLCLRLLSGMIIKDPKFQGDIIGWTRHNPLPELTGTEKEHHILELAYNSLDKKKQVLISKLSAFRNPMDYDSIAIFNEFETDKKFDEALMEMVDRGLLLKDTESSKYDLHPIVRRYCYDRLKGKKGVHSRLRDYFAAVPKAKTVESLQNLQPVVESYHHTVNSGRYDEAYDLFQGRLNEPSHYRFGAHALRIDLIRALFPDGEDKPPRLKTDDAQARTWTALANSYYLSGEPKKAIPLFERQIAVRKRHDEKLNVAIGLGNLGSSAQISIGDLKSAESNLREMIRLCQEIDDERYEATGHGELGLLLVYQGKFGEAEKELTKAQGVVDKYGPALTNFVAVVRTDLSLLALFTGDSSKALKFAKKALELTKQCEEAKCPYVGPRDIIRAKWLLGAAYLANGDSEKAEKHLNEALVRDRRINLVDLEPDILLELAKLRVAQGHREEAPELADEALRIADRCEYRLKQADIHNFLAEFYLDAKDFSKAKEHMEIAKERAACGYKPAMDKAEELLRRLKKH